MDAAGGACGGGREVVNEGECGEGTKGETTQNRWKTRDRLSYIQTIAAVFRQYQLAAAVLLHFLA